MPLCNNVCGLKKKIPIWVSRGSVGTVLAPPPHPQHTLHPKTIQIES